MARYYDRIHSWSEWLVALVMIFGGISLFFSDPVSTGGPITRVLGSLAAGIIYGVIFSFSGLVLMFSKYLKKKKTHKYALMAIYLISIYTFALEVALIGWSWFLLDSVAIFLMTGIAWVRWKHKTEYLDPDEFQKFVREINAIPDH